MRLRRAITSIAGFVLGAGLGTAIVTGGAIASADTATTAVGPTVEASTAGTYPGDSLSQRRRATFTGASVTEMKVDDLDANNNKK